VKEDKPSPLFKFGGKKTSDTDDVVEVDGLGEGIDLVQSRWERILRGNKFDNLQAFFKFLNLKA
jgi:hypothetical protein